MVFSAFLNDCPIRVQRQKKGTWFRCHPNMEVVTGRNLIFYCSASLNISDFDKVMGVHGLNGRTAGITSHFNLQFISKN